MPFGHFLFPQTRDHNGGGNNQDAPQGPGPVQPGSHLPVSMRLYHLGHEFLSWIHRSQPFQFVTLVGFYEQQQQCCNNGDS